MRIAIGNSRSSPSIATLSAVPDPIVSMDTKHKEFLGLFFRQGRLYTQRAKKALDHDFPSAAFGVIYPHGFYDIKRNVGHLNLGLSHEPVGSPATASAAGGKRKAGPLSPARTCSCYATAAAATPPTATCSSITWKACRPLGLEIRVAHYPPYCSKYNPIEHRFFPHVTHACQGLLLTSLK